MSKQLKNILDKVKVLETIGTLSSIVSMLTFDSRNIVENALFIAIKGNVVDGHNYINKAIELGAKTILCQRLPQEIKEEITYLRVENSQVALAYLAANFYDNPSDKLNLIGVTGTNGKTTTTTLLFEMFSSLNLKSCLLSTIKVVIDKQEIPATHTTPDVIRTNKYLAQAVEKGCEYAFMEVSSHGISQHRIEGLNFKGALFTNITHDHLDYHNTFKEYLNVKKTFFDNLGKSAFAITNIDDRNGLVMLQNSKAKKYTYALKSDADFKIKILENRLDGQLLQVNQYELWSQLVGKFNAYNITAVFAVAKLLGLEDLTTLTAISKLANVDGRFQAKTSQTGVVSIVDYAHTPDALKNVLETIQEIKTPQEKIITLVGCGGDRDKTKRPLMAKIAAQFSDQLILTSDNPRTEDPLDILKDMEGGIPLDKIANTLVIADREQAIKTAVTMAKPKDVILIAGKGHESYQDINGVKSHFNDQEVVINWLEKLKK